MEERSGHSPSHTYFRNWNHSKIFGSQIKTIVNSFLLAFSNSKISDLANKSSDLHISVRPNVVAKIQLSVTFSFTFTVYRFDNNANIKITLRGISSQGLVTNCSSYQHLRNKSNILNCFSFFCLLYYISKLY